MGEFQATSKGKRATVEETKIKNGIRSKAKSEAAVVRTTIGMLSARGNKRRDKKRPGKRSGGLRAIECWLELF